MILRASLDGLSFAVVVGALVDVLPPVAAAASLIYACIRIWESKTMQQWMTRDKRSQADTVDPRQPRDYVKEGGGPLGVKPVNASEAPAANPKPRSYPHDTD